MKPVDPGDPTNGEARRGPDRRTFLKRSGGAAAAAAMVGCVPDGEGGVANAGGDGLDPTLLRSVAEVVLPAELGPEGRERAVSAFESWARDYQPAAELNHGYGTSRIRYGPADPVPGWTAQLEALDLEARARHGAGYGELDPDRRSELIRGRLSDQGGAMPTPLEARHVAVALLAHWSGSPEAVNLCYGHLVSPRTCRGIGDVSALPGAVS